MSFPSRLRQLRSETGLTQEELSKRLHINRTTYAHYETGRRLPDMETIRMLANFFDCSVDYIIGESNMRKSKQEDTSPEELPKSLEEYVKQADELTLYGDAVSEKDKKAILAALKAAYEAVIKANEEDKNK